MNAAELDRAMVVAAQLRDQAAEEVAALVGFLESTRRGDVRFDIGAGEWKYDYEAPSKTGYGSRRGVATARFARLFRHPGDRCQLLCSAGPYPDFVSAVSVKYGFLRDQMGGFKNLVAAVRKELEKQLTKNSDGRSEALAELAGLGLSDGGAA